MAEMPSASGSGHALRNGPGARCDWNNPELDVGRGRCVRYTLGRVHITTDLRSFHTNPHAALDRARACPGSVRWTSGGYTDLVASEKAADRIVEEVRQRFAELTVEDGLKPLRAVHGMACYERYLRVTGAEGGLQQVRDVIAARIGADAGRVVERMENLTPAQIDVF